MDIEKIDGNLLKSAFVGAVNYLLLNKDHVNALNVFPVPDGDTGTNMSLTSKSAIKMVEKTESKDVHEIAMAAARGSLMGARGNSGVILSQFLRGFAEGLTDVKEIGIRELAYALKKASDTTYKAVMKPTEGTILTVGRETSDFAIKNYKKYRDLKSFGRDLVKEAYISLEKTPEKLSVLKEAGVVDSGGAGLVYLLEGAYKTLCGEKIQSVEEDEQLKNKKQKEIHLNEEFNEELEFGYCTEFVISTNYEDIDSFKEKLSPLGDCLLVVGGSGTGVIKVHVHTNNPGKALEYAVELGQLQDIKIDNMRYQHRETLFDEAQVQAAKKENKEVKIDKDYSFIAVSMGEKMNEVFKSLNVDYIVEGGQTMNPSTEDFMKAIGKCSGKTIFIIPNNSNIILAAEQAQKLSERNVIVIPSKSIPEGISAIVEFNPNLSPEENEKNMKDYMATVKSAQVTYAVRDTVSEGRQIKKDEIIGLTGKRIVSFGKDINEVAFKLIEEMVDEDSSVITIYYGNGLKEEDTKELLERLEESFDEQDIELVEGSQPLYYYIIAVE